KTIVATAAILKTANDDFKTLFMAPTEVLANQHYEGLKKLLSNWGIKTALVTSNSKPENLNSYDVVIGTHALLNDKLQINKLNLVIVDEQHRFGVNQRSKLKNQIQEDHTPHYLSLSATPIPRTIFLSLFSDLDVSTLDSVPQNRLPIITRLVTDTNKNKVLTLVKKEINSKHKVFVINPVIDQSKKGISSIQKIINEFKKEFPSFKIDGLHGRLSSEQKINIMDDFKNGDLNILIATTVIEVGIDIPDATIMWIKGAENFGLATLHQLRGRVGRSNLQSYCFVETNDKEKESIDRLTMFIKTLDGSKLAKADLNIRGPGAFFDTKQSGFLKLKIADITNIKLIKQAHKAAKKLLKEDPILKNYPEIKKKILTNLTAHSE
ncbi:MAG: helicase-related protein, partial [Patescibacteria group bacterium]|nr:helicase-related protein [Patescibacteria group bacterium]